MPLVARSFVKLDVDQMSQSKDQYELYKDPLQSDVCENIENVKGITTLYQKTGNCKSRKKKSKAKNNRRRHTNNFTNLLPLTHSSVITNDFVSYQVEQPNRIAVRLELLMDSAVIKLNDKEYMEKLHHKLVEDEIRNEKKYLKNREKKEKERVKDLVISGKMNPTDDLLHLYKHPVFRVNKMLQRLEDHSASFYTQDKPKVTAVAIEPYEFEPNGKFFSHLHNTGELWVPSEEILAREERFQGKVARAKQRLIEKRHREAEEAKLMRTLFKSDEERADPYQSMTTLGSSGSPYGESDNSEQRAGRGKMKRDLLREETRMAIKDRQRAELLEQRERERRARQEARMKERNKQFFEEKEHERDRIIEKHQQRIAKYDHSMTLFPEPEYKNSALGSMFRMEDTPPHLKEDESFKRLRKKYHLRGTSIFDTYRPPVNPLVAKYIDGCQDTKHLYEYGNAIRGVYNREMRRTDDFMLKLNRL